MTYYHPILRFMLVVYVDDLKLAGHSVHMAVGWTLFREVLDIDDPYLARLFMGCQREVEYGINWCRPISSPPLGPVSIITYNKEA